jgi:hypothetical protein
VIRECLTIRSYFVDLGLINEISAGGEAEIPLFRLKIPLFGQVTEFTRKYLISFRDWSVLRQLGWAIFNFRCF